MRKNNFRRVFGLALAILMAGSLAVSCYDDSELRASIDDLKTQLSQLQTLVSTLQNDDAVTGVTQNADGSYTINFKKSGAVTIRNGKDGKDGDPGKDGKDGTILEVVKGGETYTFIFSDGTTITLPRYCETRVLTFEDIDYKGPEDNARYWSSKIDDPQIYGEILYGTGCLWNDENNTFLYGSVLPYDPETWSGGLSGGGIAISNYGNGMLTGADYTRQLEVFDSELDGAGRQNCGNRGSNNFAIVYDGGLFGSNPAALTMSDGVARVIESAYVNNTCYALNSLLNGDDYAAPMANNGFFKIRATGYNGGLEMSHLDFYLAQNISFVTSWTRWDLSGLGYVDKVVFSLIGSDELYSDYGFGPMLNTPTYFAIDDVAVRYYPD